MTHYKNYGNNEYLCISDNDTCEYFEDENLYKNDNQFREYLNYDEIISNVGNHNNKDTYLYLLLIENAYDSIEDKYFNYIKIGYTEDPINRFHKIYSDFYPIGEMKILMFIKMSYAKPYEQKIHKLCHKYRLENINSKTFSKSKECYSYYDIEVKNIVNSYLLENKKYFLSHYFDKNTDYFTQLLNTKLYKKINTVDHKIDILENEMKNLKINMNEKESQNYKLSVKDYESILSVSNDDCLNNKDIQNLIINYEIKECPKINKLLQRKYVALYFNDPYNNMIGWFYGKIKIFRNIKPRKSPHKPNMTIEIFTKENNLEIKIIALTENYGIGKYWVLLKDNMSI